MTVSPARYNSRSTVRAAGKPTGKILDQQADKWAFMLDAMDFEPQY